LVRLGNTKVLCGITVQIGVPSTVPNHGDIVVVPSDEALQSILTQTLDLSCLGIMEAKAAWRLLVTWHVLQDDGNVWDAVLVAAVAALMDTRLPATQHNANTGTMELVDTSEEVLGTPLMFQFVPVPLTVGIYGAPDGVIHLLADPTQDEVPLLEGYLTMVVSDDDQIVHTRHASKLGLRRDDLTVCAHMAYGRGKEIRALLSP
jgi:exosome complex component RRP42